MRRNHKNHIGSPCRPVFAVPFSLEMAIKVTVVSAVERRTGREILRRKIEKAEGDQSKDTLSSILKEQLLDSDSQESMVELSVSR